MWDIGDTSGERRKQKKGYTCWIEGDSGGWGDAKTHRIGGALLFAWISDAEPSSSTGNSATYGKT